MASTVTPSTLTVKITETISLNGSPHGATNTKTIASINEISKRILTITTNEATIATFSGAVASSGHFNDSFVRYMRFTNSDNDEFAMKVDAGNSFMVFADNSGGMVGMFNAIAAGDAASDTALGSLTTIQADANTGNCDLEMFVASV